MTTAFVTWMNGAFGTRAANYCLYHGWWRLGAASGRGWLPENPKNQNARLRKLRKDGALMQSWGRGACAPLGAPAKNCLACPILPAYFSATSTVYPTRAAEELGLEHDFCAVGSRFAALSAGCPSPAVEAVAKGEFWPMAYALKPSPRTPCGLR